MILTSMMSTIPLPLMSAYGFQYWVPGVDWKAKATTDASIMETSPSWSISPNGRMWTSDFTENVLLPIFPGVSPGTGETVSTSLYLPGATPDVFQLIVRYVAWPGLTVPVAEPAT